MQYVSHNSDALGGWLVSVSQAPTMSSKARIGGLLLGLVLLALFGLLSPVSTALLKPYDDARLKAFAHKVAGADRVVATHIGKAVAVEIKDAGIATIIREVSDARTARLAPGKDYACVFGVKATFYKGTNVLDFIEMCGSLFRFHNGAPYEYGTGALIDLIYRPVIAAVNNNQ